MAFYQYECDTCHHIQEEMHGMNETPEIKCEKCGKLCSKNITGGAAVHFKGSGFYETDYNKKISRSEVIDDAMNAGAHKR